MAKKIVKKVPVAKSTKKAALPGSLMKREHRSFVGLTLLLIAFSAYAITSFFTSTNDYISGVSANVSGSDEIEVVDDKENPFADLDTTADYAQAVVELYHAGIVNGYSDGTFGADKKVTRAEFLKLLVEAADIDYAAIPPEKLENCFKDVKATKEHWFAPYVCAGKFNSLANGYGDGSFGVTRNINKAEALKIILLAFGFEIDDMDDIDELPFADISKDKDWFVAVAKSGKDNKIIPGKGTFNAGWELTRGDVAKMIYNAMVEKELL